MRRRGLSIPSLFLLLALGLSVGACSWKPKEAVFLAVWADDDSGHAYIVTQWEERKVSHVLDTVTERRNHEYQLFVQNADGSERRALTALRPGQLGPDLFFMKRQGYVIYSEVLDVPELVVHKVDLAGNEQTVARGDAFFQPCGALTAVPSPDGTRLAVFERESTSGAYPTGEAASGAIAECADITITVRFLDAATLTQQGTWTWEAYGFTEYGWRPDDAFYVQAMDGSWRVDPSEGPQVVATPACLVPKTTSSHVSSTGVHVEPTTDPSDPVDTWSVGAGATFEGCGG